MKYIFTNYLYPLRERICFLNKFGFAFDNARTPEEIAEIEGMLNAAIPDGTSLMSLFGKSSNENDPFTLSTTIYGIFQHLPLNDPYVREFVKDCIDNQVQPLNVLARMWVVVTIDESTIEEIRQKLEKKMPPKENKSLEWLPSTTPELFLQERLYELAHLVGLLTCKYKYWDFDSFLANSSPLREVKNLGGIVFGYCIGCYPPEVTAGLKPLSWFHQDSDQMLSVFEEIEKDVHSDDGELILYISNLIYASINHTLDNKAKLLILVSIIELMLTHNPDFNRFNVEDSINKQFQLKAALVVYQNDKTKDINGVKESLSNIYNIRSKIAHGDFKALKKIVQKELKHLDYTREIEQHYLYELNELLYSYIKAIVEEYFKDRKFIEFIKRN